MALKEPDDRGPGDFTIDDDAVGIIEKMVRRNPHVFGTERDGDLTPAEVNELWESVKAAEKQRDSVTDGIPPGLLALVAEARDDGVDPEQALRDAVRRRHQLPAVGAGPTLERPGERVGDPAAVEPAGLLPHHLAVDDAAVDQ